MLAVLLVLTVVMIGPLLLERLERRVFAPPRANAEPVRATSKMDGEAS